MGRRNAVNLSGIVLAVFGILSVGTSEGAGLAFEAVVSGLARPVAVAHADDGSGRLFIVLQEGGIVVLEGSSLRSVPFLDISNKVSCCGERGFLGLAFHPNYSENGFFYVNYTDAGGTTVVSRFRVSLDPNVASSGSETVLLTIAQPFGNHNGGQLQFGPDGYLYIGTGDGGSGGDPQNNGQNLSTLLGKILRVDVDGGTPYAIPLDNPYKGSSVFREEIWAFGLRNPWRFSFDRITGDMFIGDVGQNTWEEIDYQAHGEPGGKNFGWRITEGNHCFNPSTGCNTSGLALPIAEYAHSQGCAVTGGYRYRGSRNQPLSGTYLFGDYCTGRIWGAVPRTGGTWTVTELNDTDFTISAFGEDEEGEVYVVDYKATTGTLYRIVAPLVVSPPSGRYLEGQALEPAVIINLDGSAVTSVSILLDGVDVTLPFAQCIQGTALAGGGFGLWCPGLRGGTLGPGVHEFAVILNLGDGAVVRDSALWEVLESVR